MTPQHEMDLYGPPPDFRQDRLKAAFITSLVGMATNLSAREIAERTRSTQPVTRARQLAIYLAHITLSWPLARVAYAFGRDRTTAGNAVRIIEDLRDDPVMDARLSTLESCILQAPGSWTGDRS